MALEVVEGGDDCPLRLAGRVGRWGYLTEPHGPVLEGQADKNVVRRLLTSRRHDKGNLQWEIERLRGEVGDLHAFTSLSVWRRAAPVRVTRPIPNEASDEAPTS